MCSMKKLTEKVHLLRELERQAEDIETQINILKDELKSEMDKRCVDELIGPDWKVTWKTVNSSRFDQKSFKESNPNLYESFVVVNSYKKFSVR